MRVQVGNLSVDLTDDQVDDLRRQLGVSHPAHGDGLVDAAAVAARLGVTREFVYSHAEELGGQKIASGPKAPWRFDPAWLEQAGPERQATAPKPKPKHRRRQAKRAGLLESRGTSPYAS